MKLFSKKNIAFLAIVAVGAIGIFQVDAQQSTPDIQDFITGQKDVVARTGSLFISSDSQAGLETHTTFGKSSGSGGAEGPNHDVCHGDESSRSGVCLEVDGLVFGNSIFSEIPVIIGGDFVLRQGGLPGTRDAFQIEGKLMDWSMSYKDSSNNPSPRSVYNGVVASPSGDLRAVCSDELGRLLPCGESSAGDPLSWDFDFYLASENTGSNSATGRGSGYASSGFTHNWPEITINSSIPTSWNGYGVLIGIDDEGDFGDLECQYSHSPVGYVTDNDFFALTPYTAGPRSVSTMRWEDITSGDILLESGAPDFTSNTFNGKASGADPFYTAVMVPHVIESDDAYRYGVSNGVIRCRTAETSTNAAGDWKYLNLYQPRNTSDTIDDLDSEYLVELERTSSGANYKLEWDSVPNDISPGGFYYSLIRGKENQGGGGSWSYSVVSTSQTARSYTVNRTCDDTLYYIRVSQCNPDHSGCDLTNSSGDPRRNSNVVNAKDSSTCTGGV
jgi:hypothetical protein